MLFHSAKEQSTSDFHSYFNIFCIPSWQNGPFSERWSNVLKPPLNQLVRFKGAFNSDHCAVWVMLPANWNPFLYCERMRARYHGYFVSIRIEDLQLIDNDLKKYKTWINAGIHTNKHTLYDIEPQSELPLLDMLQIGTGSTIYRMIYVSSMNHSKTVWFLNLCRRGTL